MKKRKPIPKFKNEDEEAEFWLTHDTTDYFDYDTRVQMDFSNLKPSTQKVTLRLPTSMLRYLKKIAHQRDVPYQSLMKMFVAEKIDEIHGVKYAK
jgi:predicted DNA binding CopG/RHH family protein